MGVFMDSLGLAKQPIPRLKIEVLELAPGQAPGPFAFSSAY